MSLHLTRKSQTVIDSAHLQEGPTVVVAQYPVAFVFVAVYWPDTSLQIGTTATPRLGFLVVAWVHQQPIFVVRCSIHKETVLPTCRSKLASVEEASCRHKIGESASHEAASFTP